MIGRFHSVLMIDSSKTCKSLVGVEIQSLYFVIERCSNGVIPVAPDSVMNWNLKVTDFMEDEKPKY